MGQLDERSKSFKFGHVTGAEFNFDPHHIVACASSTSNRIVPTTPDSTISGQESFKTPPSSFQLPIMSLSKEPSSTVTGPSSKEDLEYIILDVFTREKYKGNPLAVVFDSSEW